MFPNWNNAKGCGDAFWVGKYAASHADSTTNTQGSSAIPVSKKNKCSWVNTTWTNQVASCLSKGTGFHCIRNREWVSIALWTQKMGIDVKGNGFGYLNNGANIDGEGTNITSDTADLSANPPEKPTDTYVKTRTGMGPNSFRHNGKSDGISDLVGNVYECVDGLQLRAGVPYILDENNQNYVALATSDISSYDFDTDTSKAGQTISYINNSSDDLLNEGLPVTSAGMPVTGSDKYFARRTSNRSCSRGGNCGDGDGVGMWALLLLYESSISSWDFGFRLARTL